MRFSSLVALMTPHGDYEWIPKLMKLIMWIWTKLPDVKLTGIYFGHQVLCRVLGSEMKPNPEGEWELVHTALDLTEVRRKLLGLPEGETRILPASDVAGPRCQRPLALNDGPARARDEGACVGRSELTDVQGMYIQRRVFTSQGQMEFDDKMVRRQLETLVKSGAVTLDEATEAAEKAEWVHDGVRVAQAVLRFFHGDDDAIEAR
ncbi:hypothetical protein DL768_006312 [Monosporascus sp. mg162]|nr:hypothetical protein DL768_006312 [Monosporascus sp. mg162]